MDSSARIACGTAKNALETQGEASQDKTVLRARLSAARKALDKAQRSVWDTALCEKVLAWWKKNPVSSLGVYWPIQNEPDLSRACNELAQQGVQLALPLVVEKDQPLEFAAWRPGDAMQRAAFGVAIPAEIEPVVLPQALLIPCLGFNRANFRLGYGGGFYDRTLATSARPLTVGIAYSFSLVEFEAGPYDVAMDAILTEASSL